MPARSLRSLAAAVLCFGILIFAARSQPWDPPEFPISFWCGPPDGFISAERFREAKEAGFNYLMPPCGGVTPDGNRRILDAAREAGIKAFISDGRLGGSLKDGDAARDGVRAVVADFASHPALAGYFLTDEPGVERFSDLADLIALLRELDPAHPAYINLFPNYASAKQLGVADYAEYLDRFLREARPFVLSYDHYHFMKNGSDGALFFSNLEQVRSAAAKRDLPFWQIVLSIQCCGYRQPTEAEKLWEGMQTLAYGGKGLMFFTYWTPGAISADMAPAIIDADGRRTAQYDEIRRVNAEVRLLGNELLHAEPLEVFQTGALPPGGLARPKNSPVVAGDKSDLTIGLFHRDRGTLILVCNRDYRAATDAAIGVLTFGEALERFDHASGSWVPASAPLSFEGVATLRAKLAPGAAELYRW